MFIVIFLPDNAGKGYRACHAENICTKWSFSPLTAKLSVTTGWNWHHIVEPIILQLKSRNA